MKQLTSLLALITCTGLGHGLRVVVRDDPTAFVNDQVTLTCQGEDLRDDLESCIWTSPEGLSYSSRDRDNNVRVSLFERDGICEVRIDQAFLDHSGPWICSLREFRGDEMAKYVFLTVVSNNDDLSRLGESAKLVTAEQGLDVEIICPVNTFVSKNRKPVCTWTGPDQRDYQVLGSTGENSRYTGISYAGSAVRGECGIRIDRVDRNHFGTWTCKVLTDRRDGKLGSQVVTGTVHLADRFRSRRLEEEETLQGYRDGDRDVELSLNVTLPDNIERDSRLYWIVQRQYVVREGDRECPRDLRTCYESDRRQWYRDDQDKYEMRITFEELTLEDIQAPVMLINEFLDPRTREIRYSMHKLPTERFDQLVNEGCVINNEFVSVNEFFEDRRLCIEVQCIDDGRVEVNTLRNC